MYVEPRPASDVEQEVLIVIEPNMKESGKRGKMRGMDCRIWLRL